MDHIVENETTKDAVAVLSIVEAIFGKVSHTIPTIKEMTIRTDKATTYKNSLMYVLMPWIARKYGIRIRKILHTELQRGKCVADAIFAVRMRHCHRCVAETTCDIVTPKDLVEALRDKGGTAIGAHSNR